jgi:pseudouridine-5'-monophosphatase
VVWVPDQNLLDLGSSQVTERPPDQVLRSLEAFVPEEWGLPPFDPDNVVVGGQQSGTEA